MGKPNIGMFDGVHAQLDGSGIIRSKFCFMMRDSILTWSHTPNCFKPFNRLNCAVSTIRRQISSSSTPPWIGSLNILLRLSAVQSRWVLVFSGVIGSVVCSYPWSRCLFLVLSAVSGEKLWFWEFLDFEGVLLGANAAASFILQTWNQLLTWLFTDQWELGAWYTTHSTEPEHIFQ